MHNSLQEENQVEDCWDTNPGSLAYVRILVNCRISYYRS